MTQLPNESLFGDYGEWPGRDVLDSGGQRLGGVREIYLDRETGRPEWVLVDVDGDEARFVPLADAAVEDTAIRVAHAASVIRDAPGIGAEPRIDQAEERRLYAHYGLGYSEDDSGSGLPADEPPTHEHERPAAFKAPDDAEDAPAPQSETPSSWSDVAPSDTNVSPPAAEPPSATEIESADISEPPAVTDRASDPMPLGAAFGTPEPATTERESDPASAGLDTSSTPDSATSYDSPGEPATTEFDDLPTTPPPTTGTADFDTPSVPESEPPALTPHAAAPEAASPDLAPPVEPAPTPPSPAAETPRPSSTWSPPEPDQGGGPLAIIKSRPAGIAIGVVVAAVLLMIIRRLR